MSLSWLPLWTNQRIVLYHGTVSRHTTSLMHGIDVRRGRTELDFGQGFYVTTVRSQARSWARQKANLFENRGTTPALVSVTLSRDDLAQLDALYFIRGQPDALDYWSLVRHCRRGGDHGRSGRAGPWYDAVAGPVALEWLTSLKVHPSHDQISLHTDRAQRVLNHGTRQIEPW